MRFPKLLTRWKAWQPQATVCFGRSSWGEFRYLFTLKEGDPLESISVYYQERTMLIPFLGQGTPPMNSQSVDRIAATLRRWGVAQP